MYIGEQVIRMQSYIRSRTERLRDIRLRFEKLPSAAI